ncbi:MAG: hypothetical protein ACLUFT_10250 [Gemmiger formicilis]|uniref:hypothetical protein n=1 Tax=Gemmiger formicilis TaxID=745368 RepID=UPI003995773C
MFGAWSLWDIAATRRAAAGQTLRFAAGRRAADSGFAELRALNRRLRLADAGRHLHRLSRRAGADNMVYVNTDVRRFFAFWRDIFGLRCPADFTAPYSIVYGHHIEDGGMFGDIAVHPKRLLSRTPRAH